MANHCIHCDLAATDSEQWAVYRVRITCLKERYSGFRECHRRRAQATRLVSCHILPYSRRSHGIAGFLWLAKLCVNDDSGQQNFLHVKSGKFHKKLRVNFNLCFTLDHNQSLSRPTQQTSALDPTLCQSSWLRFGTWAWNRNRRHGSNSDDE